MRLGINVPNELINRIKAVQPDVNISQVCRDAIQDLAIGHERVTDWLAEDDSIVRVLEFAKAHEEMYREVDWYVLGLDDAQEWVSTVSTGGWERFLYEYDFLEKKGRTDFAKLVGGNHYHKNKKGFDFLADQYANWFERIDEYEDQFGVSTGFWFDSKERFEKAWVAYVSEVRRQYLEYCQILREETVTEKESALQSRPVPKLPSQLLER